MNGNLGIKKRSRGRQFSLALANRHILDRRSPCVRVPVERVPDGQSVREVNYGRRFLQESQPGDSSYDARGGIECPDQGDAVWVGRNLWASTGHNIDKCLAYIQTPRPQYLLRS